MNPIKFRAWHKAERKICAVTNMNFSNQTAFLISIKPLPDTVEENLIIYSPLDGRACPWSDIVLMQYTGLKDKNTREIYDGDILRVKSQPELNTVRWGSACWTIRPAHFRLDTKYEKEIIGNIYENPELLTLGKGER